MEVITIQSEAFKEIIKKIDDLNARLNSKEKAPVIQRLDNEEFTRLMKISKRTAQHYRDSGLISFNQVGAKIYYRLDDIENLFNRNYHKAFKK